MAFCSQPGTVGMLLVGTVALVTACSGDGDAASQRRDVAAAGRGGSSAGGATGGMAASLNGGMPGAPNGGTGGATIGGGGGGDAAGTGGAGMGAHCPGGAAVDAFALFIEQAQDCPGYSFPGPVGRRKIGIELPTAASDNTPYALSFEFRNTPIDLQIWSANAMCGAAAEKLVDVHYGAASGTYCLDLESANAFSHLIFSVETTFEMRTAAFCPGTMCPP